MISMRAIDAKILEELEMLYGDKNCLASLQDWFGTAEVYWINIKQLFSIADYAKKHNPDAVKEIDNYSKQIVELFQQTKNYASGWSTKQNEKHSLSTEDYAEASNESWDELDKWTISQEKLRQSILDFMELLKSVEIKP
jgi:hypothetical protein